MKILDPILTDICATHKPIKGGYFKYEDKWERNAEQRQCPKCLRWFFHGEFGRGWKAALIKETIEILNP